MNDVESNKYYKQLNDYLKTYSSQNNRTISVIFFTKTYKCQFIFFLSDF